jgi:hypothetical protein
MNAYLKIYLLVLLFCGTTLFAQETRLQPKSTGTYASDIGTVADAQGQALAQAKDLLQQTENPTTRSSLNTAINEMERSMAALADAKSKPEKLPAAVAAEQSAYEALLKTLPREFRVSRSQNGRQGGRQAGEASQQEVNQLEMTDEQNRYETEREATGAPNEQQREQLQVADRLKELAQRQQDLNDRLRELQTALTEARTPQEREEAQRQLKRLSDEERQMLADMDELRQQVEQSPNANSMANTRQQLEQSRSDAERAAREMDNQSPSQALAAGSRTQQQLENMRQDVKSQASSRFTEQMRQMRTQARELANREDEVARSLDSLAGSEHKSLDDSAQRQQLSQQVARQQSSLSNLLSQMQDVTQRAESTEPLLSQQLYDAVRRESQAHTDNILDAEQQLVEHGLMSQAGEAEHVAHTNINELRQHIERAAESVLGNEADSLRFAEKQLDELTSRLERELAGAETNSNFEGGAGGRSNSLASADQSRSSATNIANRLMEQRQQRAGTNLMANNSASGQSGNVGRQSSGANSQGGEDPQSGQDSQNGQNSQTGQGAQTGQNSRTGQNSQAGTQGEAGGQQANNGGNSGQRGENTQAAGQNQQPGGQQGRGQGQGGGQQLSEDQQQGAGQDGSGTQEANATGNRGGDLNNLVRQFGGARGAGGLNRGEGDAANNGPITGSDFVDWSSRMRDVEQVLDEQALRNQLATARERAAAMRAEFRQSRIKPKADLVRRQILDPITEVRVQLHDDLARLADTNNLVPLDHDPVPENYSELVRKYYEKLGGSP